MDFSPHLNAIARTMGAAATYAPAVGASVSCRAIRQGGGRALAFGPVTVVLDEVVFHVLRSEIPAPVSGDTITVSGVAYTVEAVEPVERDSHQLKWALKVSWGVEVLYRAVSGSGVSQNPPQLGGTITVAANAASGAATLSIKAGMLIGKVDGGDAFTIAGDETEYEIIGAVQAASNQLANVPISPALVADAAAGAAVEFGFMRDYPVRAAMAGYQANELLGGVQAGDRRITLPQAHLDAAGMTDEPKAGDKIILGGKVYNIISAAALYQGDGAAYWDIQAR